MNYLWKLLEIREIMCPYLKEQWNWKMKKK